MTKISQLEKRVRALLTARPELRDNDQRLVSNVWWQCLKFDKIDPDTMPSTKLLLLLSQGKLPNHDSITRARRKLQEVDESLRGEKYNKRQGHQAEVIEDLKTIK